MTEITQDMKVLLKIKVKNKKMNLEQQKKDNAKRPRNPLTKLNRACNMNMFSMRNCDA